MRMLSSSLRAAAPCGLLLVGLLAPLPARAGTRVDLDGAWRFRVDDAGSGEAQGWSRKPPADTEVVDVPHTWGVGLHAEHEGIAWYWREVELAPALRGRRVELHFGATFYRARVWVGGVPVGEHEGGYTAWWVDVTEPLGEGGLVAVEVDNRPGLDTIPGWAMRLVGSGSVWYDWWHYGGLVRDVFLVAQEKAVIRRQEIRTEVGGSTATVHARAFLESFGFSEPGRLEARVVGPSGAEVAVTHVELPAGSLGDGAPTAIPLPPLEVPSPRLWHFDHPYLYRLDLRLLDAAGALLDERSDDFGIRTVEIRERGLWLNGERVRLTGITRHEDSPWEGLAETRGTMKHDWDDLKALQVTLTRPVHYPQPPWILDYADRHGILLMPEIPMWQFSEEQMKDVRVLELAKKMMREMIEQDFNHPSIFAWSVCNESATSTPGGRAYVKAMRDHVQTLDPDRFVSYADDGLAWIRDPAKNANQYTDFVMMNQYFGSWHGPEDRLAPTLDRLGRLFPDKMFVISEFGLAGPFAPDAREADEMRVDILRRQLAEFARHDFVAGAVFWCYQDYKSHRNLSPGDTTGWVDMGLVDENRQRRPSYDAWRRATSPARLTLGWRRGEGGRPVGFQATIERRGPEELPSYELTGYRAEWEVRDHGGTILSSGEKPLDPIGPPARLEGSWAPSNSREIRLRVRVLRPTGFVAAEREERWWESLSGGLSPEEARRRGLAAPPRP